LVKILHPLSQIAARIAAADGNGVPLTHAVDDGPLVDPIAAVQQALSEPLDFPPLAAGIVPGDHFAIAVDSNVPRVGSIVRGTADALIDAGVAAQDVTVVTCNLETAQRCRDEFPDTTSAPQFVVHDPSDEQNLCVIGMTKRGVAVRVNRTLFEADVVLPIGCARVRAHGAYESLFPQFFGAETIAKYRTPSLRKELTPVKGKRSAADEAGWMVGPPMTMLVVPAGNEQVSQVLAGEPRAVARRGKKLCRERWLLHSRQRVNLVVATVTGGNSAQTWANVARALAMAERIGEEKCAVAICSNLAEPPGKSLGRLVGSDDLAATERKISHDAAADTWAAWHLARALQRGPVYFMSQLTTEAVEDLGLAPVESVDDLVRLAGRHESFAVVADAQYAVVKVDATNGEV